MLTRGAGGAREPASEEARRRERFLYMPGSGIGSHVVLGGSGFVGSRTAAILRASGAAVPVVDRRAPPRALLDRGVKWVQRDVLTEAGPLPAGHAVVAIGTGDPR